MAEKKVAKLIPYEVQYVCDECNQGYMYPTGKNFMTYPMQIEHQCSNEKCGAKKNFIEEKYPKVHYDRVEL